MTAYRTHRRLAAIVTAAMLSFAWVEAVPAQQVPASTGDEITVTAPRTVNNRVKRRDRSSGGPVVVSIQLAVMRHDLDLTRPTDAARLMTRVDTAAHDACRYLDRLYPLDPDKNCVSRAIANATPLAQAQIDAAVFRQSHGDPAP